ncbi:MAG: hypothetical protein HY983_03505 [Candidatus Magasanikbacteria bacterium]|nr:hypothetical protein [Candidatus Magasanikbacteria bacterium]
MLQGGKKSIFRLYAQPWKNVQGALATLLQAEPQVASLNLPNTEVFYQHVKALSARANETDDNSPLFIIDREIIRSLETDMVEEFLKDPTDVVIRDNLSIELRLLAYATNTVANITPYTLEEFKTVLGGEAEYYNDSIFLATLRHAMESEDGKDYAAFILGTLPPGNAPDDIEDLYWWDDALLLATTLQLIWRFFPALTSAEQEVIVQHYFYRSLVVGVPARRWIGEALESVEDEARLTEMYALFIQALNENKESVPLNKDAAAGKKLADIYREYLARVYNEEIGILAQEKFIADFYQGSSVSPVYVGWLREALTVFSHLKKEDFV